MSAPIDPALHGAYDALVARMRADRAAGILVEDEEVNRRRGVVAAYSWLTGQTSVGPIHDGPAASRTRIETELRSAVDLIRHETRRGGRLGWEACRAVGIAQTLECSLGTKPPTSLVSWPQDPADERAA